MVASDPEREQTLPGQQPRLSLKRANSAQSTVSEAMSFPNGLVPTSFAWVLPCCVLLETFL